MTPTERTDLLAAVTAERNDCRWFTTPPKVTTTPDDEVTCARRRRALVEDDMDRGHWVTRRGVQHWEVGA